MLNQSSRRIIAALAEEEVLSEVVHALADACRDYRCGTVKVRKQWDDCASILRRAAEEIDAYLKEEEDLS